MKIDYYWRIVDFGDVDIIQLLKEINEFVDNGYNSDMPLLLTYVFNTWCELCEISDIKPYMKQSFIVICYRCAFNFIKYEVKNDT